MRSSSGGSHSHASQVLSGFEGLEAPSPPGVPMPVTSSGKKGSAKKAPPKKT
eukprot:CAMPEP_0197452390 /NCGR_PEP_ID=MMETSP1175-20131217/31959_1 /TAXON_ID=1003142 /ORGANISM="Triceratium dubium, Strain CCMP147" /LENGTH=51 /DNA_ID=CAMNT_0042985383 /DNA_START=1 /DNA_END=152 /DNA_ORIENTATION=-